MGELTTTNSGMFGQGPGFKNTKKRPDSFKKNLEKQNAVGTAIAKAAISKSQQPKETKLPKGYAKKNFQKGIY